MIKNYMDSAKTIKATIRIPEELAILIDNAIMPYGLYTSRPDFIASAAREHAFELSEEIFSAWYGLKDIEQYSNRLYHFKDHMKEILDESQRLYEKYNGKPVTIIIRMSPRMESYVLELIEFGPKYYNMQDFVRGAVARQIQKVLKTTIGFLEASNEIFDAIFEAKLERGDEAEEGTDSKKEKGPRKISNFIRRDGPQETITYVREDGTEEITTYIKGDGTEERADHVEGFDPMLFSLKLKDFQSLIDRKPRK